MKRQGFTLIELIVVITLISVMMVFAVPRLNTSLLTSDSREVSKWMILTIQSLKEKSARQGVQLILNVDLDNHKLWTSRKKPDPAEMGELEGIPEFSEINELKENELELPKGFRLLDVSFPDEEPRRSGVVAVHFYKKGYSDQAMIHLENDQANRVTYEIKPFLLKTRIHDEYVAF